MPRYNEKGKSIPQKGVAKLGSYQNDTKRFKIKPMRIKISDQNLVSALYLKTNYLIVLVQRGYYYQCLQDLIRPVQF